VGADVIVELAGSTSTADFAPLGGGKFWGGLIPIETAVRGATTAAGLTTFVLTMGGENLSGSSESWIAVAALES
jgi:hypothetical protein